MFNLDDYIAENTHIDDEGRLVCNKCGSEIWYLAGGYICSGKATCINEDDDREVQ